MDTKQDNIRTMFETTIKFLDDNNAIWSDKPPFVDAVAAGKSCYRRDRYRLRCAAKADHLRPRPQMNRRHHAAGAAATKLNRRYFKLQELCVPAQSFALVLRQCLTGASLKSSAKRWISFGLERFESET